MNRIILVLLLICSVDLHAYKQQPATGVWEDTDVNKMDEVISYLIFNVNDQIKSEIYYYKLNRVDKIQKKIVNGCMYRIQVNLVETTCAKERKLSSKSALDDCSLSLKEKQLNCEGYVIEQTWVNPSLKMFKKPTCNFIYN